ncbi:hypothetical protein BOTBODRAFT_192850 [Botryobasidium botryosum FD-172 SS1]|uniref:RRM domain-containing protein n=1 Tax=Botryobasidium botryosum (strain FD-172 SS1) TaxID=930990 RepID=A0A067LUN7_BOTB1|nr:hypothetical protein BOTBODRAFT_192850 [Botryobasidium botryosum FD-172 SS1]
MTIGLLGMIACSRLRLASFVDGISSAFLCLTFVLVFARPSRVVDRDYVVIICRDQAFESYGQILDAVVMRDHDTGRSRGFGFFTFSSSTEAEAAVEILNDQDLEGRRIKVNLANARPGGGGVGY